MKFNFLFFTKSIFGPRVLGLRYWFQNITFYEMGYPLHYSYCNYNNNAVLFAVSRVDSCWLKLNYVGGLLLIPVDSCWFMSTRVDLYWYLCISIDLILLKTFYLNQSIVWKYQIRLKVSHFTLLNWYRSFGKTNILLTFPYYEAQTKSGGFSCRKENERNLI